MNSPKPSVVVVDDEEHILNTMGICLEAAGFQVTLFANPEQAAPEFKNRQFDLAFIDLKMAPLDGLQMLDIVKRDSPATTVVIITAHGSLDSAIGAIKKGAYYYLQKPFDFQELQIFSQKALEYHALSSEVHLLRERLPDTGSFITRNRAMLDVLDLAVQVADNRVGRPADHVVG
jgi:DNA-binding NtrC family response regulator